MYLYTFKDTFGETSEIVLVSLKVFDYIINLITVTHDCRREWSPLLITYNVYAYLECKISLLK